MKDPEDWAADMDAALLHCRELGHAWTDYTASYDAKAKCYDRTLKCASCGTERRQVLDRRGEVVRNGYAYVEGYLASGQIDTSKGRPPRAVFRLAALQRAIGPTSRKKKRRR